MNNSELLVADVEEFLATHSVWDTLGGCRELATATFLRGSIISSYGFIETQVNQIIVAASRISEDWNARRPLPKTLHERLSFFDLAFDSSSLLQALSPEASEISRFLRENQQSRNDWAHGRLVVLPSDRTQRWTAAWITLENWTPKSYTEDDQKVEQFSMSKKRITSRQLIDLALEVRRWAGRSHRFHTEVFEILPQSHEN